MVKTHGGKPFGDTGLLNRRFDGFRMFWNLLTESIPRAAGVYAVLREIGLTH